MKKSQIVDNYLEGSDISSINRAELSRKLVKEHPDIFGDDSFENTERVRAYVRGRIKRMKRNDPNLFEEKLAENNFVPTENWSHGWLKTKEGSIFIRNKEDEMSLDDVVSFIEDALAHIERVPIQRVKTGNKKALRAIITDAHVGMNSNSEDALFPFKYDESVFKSHLNILFSHIQNKVDANGAFDRIIIDDLGDSLDGYNSQTTRGGHHLPQNMSNKQAWKVYVENKLSTCIKIVELNAAKKYQFRNVGNDNHAGDFGWTANTAIKMVLERMYENVEYIVTNRPMEHFVYGDHCHILTHGKDKSLQIKNWDKYLTPKIANLIRQYIDHHEIKSRFIHLDKGDLHQYGYDREPRFDYTNFMSFAPPSQWVQINHGISYCGFSIQIIPKHSNQIEHTNVFFNLEKP